MTKRKKRDPLKALQSLYSGTWEVKPGYQTKWKVTALTKAGHIAIVCYTDNKQVATAIAKLGGAK